MVTSHQSRLEMALVRGCSHFVKSVLRSRSIDLFWRSGGTSPNNQIHRYFWLKKMREVFAHFSANSR